MNNETLSIVIPVYNEASSLIELYEEIKVNVSSFSLWEILFIDDGSTDDSGEIIRSLHEKDKRIKLIQFHRNYGKSAALSEGFNMATGKYILTMDADLQDDPAEIDNLYKKILEGYDLISGWKKLRKDPLSKRLPSKFFNRVTRLMTGVKIHEFNCGIKLYRKRVVDSLEIYGGRHRYIPALAGQKRFKISEISVHHRERKYGTTKYGGARLFHGFFDLLSIPPVSTSIKFLSFQFVFIEILSRVVPEILETIEILSPEILLKRVDFPTLGLPIIETIIKYKPLFFYFTYLRICNL